VLKIIIKRLVVGQLDTNCYIVGDKDEKRVGIIDPGGEYNKILNVIQDNNYEVTHIIITHGHIDHILCVDELRKKTFAKVLIHRKDSSALVDGGKNLSFFMGKDIRLSPADIQLEEGDVIDIGKHSFRIIHTPGHSEGGICVYTQGILFSGDTLFRNSIGRTDFPGGSHVKLIDSIKKKLFALDDKTVVYPGHGEETTIENEKNNNPYIINEIGKGDYSG
jgi:glyoxylase-like metal-dependent hydrolase (beta-lactamase superfamily II)